MKKCQYNINPESIPVKECGKEAIWEIGFCEASWDYDDWSGENDFQDCFCDKHFVHLEGMGNGVVFREIGEEEWFDYTIWDLSFRIFVQNRNIREWLKQYKTRYNHE